MNPIHRSITVDAKKPTIPASLQYAIRTAPPNLKISSKIDHPTPNERTESENVVLDTVPQILDQPQINSDCPVAPAEDISKTIADFLARKKTPSSAPKATKDATPISEGHSRTSTGRNPPSRLMGRANSTTSTGTVALSRTTSIDSTDPPLPRDPAMGLSTRPPSFPAPVELSQRISYDDPEMREHREKVLRKGTGRHINTAPETSPAIPKRNNARACRKVEPAESDTPTTSKGDPPPPVAPSGLDVEVLADAAVRITLGIADVLEGPEEEELEEIAEEVVVLVEKVLWVEVAVDDDAVVTEVVVVEVQVDEVEDEVSGVAAAGEGLSVAVVAIDLVSGTFPVALTTAVCPSGKSVPAVIVAPPIMVTVVLTLGHSALTIRPCSRSPKRLLAGPAMPAQAFATWRWTFWSESAQGWVQAAPSRKSDGEQDMMSAL
ncbi:MAG: hypothetical protein M1817_005767 [Caeruleum heppii]|nr:MAG: hypothetical protein M1817_005767 [Caeruleum heppii]